MSNNWNAIRSTMDNARYIYSVCSGHSLKVVIPYFLLIYRIGEVVMIRSGAVLADE